MPRSRTTISLSQVRVGLFVLFAIIVLVFLVLNGRYQSLQQKVALESSLRGCERIARGFGSATRGRASR
jgi:hypothetical protein